MDLNDRTLKRWIGLEAHAVNQGLVRRPVLLRDLLDQDEPRLERRDGGVHRFDREALHALADQLSPLVRANLKVPISFYIHHETPQDGYVMDRWGIKALGQLGADGEPRDGKRWMGLALARDLDRTYPTLFQFVRV